MSNTDQLVDQLRGKSTDELYQMLGSYQLSQEGGTTTAIDASTNVEQLRAAAERLLKSDGVRKLLCEINGWGVMETDKLILQAIILFQSSGFGATAAAVLAILVTKITLKEYCKED